MSARRRNLEELRTYFEGRWRTAPDTPWGDISACTIEHTKARLLRPHISGARAILDLGCGGGDFLGMVVPDHAFERVVGVDVASAAIARARLTGLYTELQTAAIETITGLVAGRFDFILLGEMLYYVPDPIAALATALDGFLADEGCVAITLAAGRSYFAERDIAGLREVLSTRGLAPLLDTRIEYFWAGAPRRYYGWAFAQTHKVVLVYARRAMSPATRR